MHYSVKRYKKEDQQQWNDFVASSKNGTFLFHRNFMEYHADRFEDYSLLLFKNNELISVFPANRLNTTVYSHQGLTYGGLVLPSINGEDVHQLFNALVSYLKDDGIHKLVIKSIPPFYHKKPSNELYFELIDQGGTLYHRDLNLAIDYSKPLSIHKNKLKNYRKREDLGFTIAETENFKPFWEDVLTPRLATKHKVSPVHSLEEIQLLKSRFPDHIKQYEIRLNNEILAGITTFETDTVVKSQYGATTDLGEEHRALDYLFISLIKKYKESGYHFFDMGTVTDGNFGLLKQKEELGCDIYTQDFYSLSI